MPTAVLPSAAETEPRRKRFTRTERDVILEASGNERLELIDGDLIDKMGQNPPHAWTIQLIAEFFSRILGFRRVRIQSPLEVANADEAWNEPEPDVAVLASEKPEYSDRHPRGDETLLVIEVADSCLRQDTVKKRDLYARAGVPEYWVVNLATRELIAHRDLRDGRYQQITTFADSACVSPGSLPAASIEILRLLP
jgi:Uma2 family endonuclease